MKKILTVIFVLLNFLLLHPANEVFAKVIVQEKGFFTIQKDEVVDDDLFISAETVEILGTVNGDVYAGAGTFRLSGTVNGNVHVGAGMTTISGVTTGSVYAGTGNITVENARIGNSLLIGAGTVNIDRDSKINGSLIIGAGSAAVGSPVGRNVFIGAGTVDLNSAVGGEVRIGGGNVTLGPNAKVARDLYYTLGKDPGAFKISDTATVSGVIHKIEQKIASQKDIETAKKSVSTVLRTVGTIAKIVSLIGAYIVGFLCLKWFNGFFTRSTKVLETSFWKSFGVGFLIIVVSLPVLFVLALTGLGVPLAGILFLMLMLGMYLSKIVAAIAVGNWLSGRFEWKKMSVYSVLGLGLIVIYILRFIPFIGFLTSLVVLGSGLGAIAIHFRSTIPAK